MNGRLAELEVELANTRRELSRSEELSLKQQREQREVGVPRKRPDDGELVGKKKRFHIVIYPRSNFQMYILSMHA